jgi:hypothetical protein
MLHELAHGWFNSSHLVPRWLNEGLAEDIATRAVAELGESLPSDDSEVEVEAFPLNDWGEPGSADDRREAYGYEASFTLIRDVFDEIGDERRVALLEAVLAGHRAYATDTAEPDGVDGPVGWRAFLDLAEQIGGSATIEQRYRDVVVTDAQLDELDRRAGSLGRYRGLDRRGGTWAVPEAVRAAMAAWRFELADELIAGADAALDLRDDLTTALAPLGLVPAAAARDRYERATDALDGVAAELDGQLAAATRLADARPRLVALLEGLGLDAAPLDQQRYESDPIGAADATEELVQLASRLAATRAEIDRLAGSFGVTVPALDRPAFATDPIAAQARLDLLLDATQVLATAHQRRDGAESPIERVGAIGTDIDARLDTADRLLAAGDAVGARVAAEAALAAIDRLDTNGALRVVTAVAIAVTVLAAVAVAMAARRRRRRPGTTDTGDTGTTGTTGTGTTGTGTTGTGTTGMGTTGTGTTGTGTTGTGTDTGAEGADAAADGTAGSGGHSGTGRPPARDAAPPADAPAAVDPAPVVVPPGDRPGSA